MVRFLPQKDQPLPVGTISAPLTTKGFTIGIDPFSLTLSRPAIGVRVGTASPENPLQRVDLVLAADIDNLLKFSIGIPTSGKTVAISTVPLPNCKGIADLLNVIPFGKDFKSYLPGEVTDLFNEVGIDNVTLLFDLARRNVNFFGISIKTTHPWHIIPDELSLEGLVLGIQITDPMGLNWKKVSIDATARFLPDVFTGEFDFSLELSEEQQKWKLDTISGRYFGTVTLGDLVQKLVGVRHRSRTSSGTLSFPISA